MDRNTICVPYVTTYYFFYIEDGSVLDVNSPFIYVPLLMSRNVTNNSTLYYYVVYYQF